VAFVDRGEASPTVGDAKIVIEENGRVEGTDGCGNDLVTELDGSHLGYRGPVTTGGCIDDREHNEAMAFWGVLSENPSFTAEGDRLRLRTDSNSGMDLERP
jgi:META domain